MDLSIVDLERFTIKLPFRQVPARNMARELPDFTFFEILRVSLHGGAIGTGEALHFYYPWAKPPTMLSSTCGAGMPMR